MCCISSETSVYVQSSGGYINFWSGALPSLLMVIFNRSSLTVLFLFFSTGSTAR